jgi:hypothetical protein
MNKDLIILALETLLDQVKDSGMNQRIKIEEQINIIKNTNAIHNANNR